ncbi:hypothetical protein ACFRCI_34325 [Streptomyces sp. NPDC056638]|uniref:hypothetical protein n=1 Tax=Streptomyces sp. NPDC056638 TaxID=3345887 RepID=UPI003682DE4F
MGLFRLGPEQALPFLTGSQELEQKNLTGNVESAATAWLRDRDEQADFDFARPGGAAIGWHCRRPRRTSRRGREINRKRVSRLMRINRIVGRHLRRKRLRKPVSRAARMRPSAQAR